MPAGLHLGDDLIFASRVTATARAHGLSLATARNAETALRLITESPPRCVIVDLHNPGLDLPAFLVNIRSVVPCMPRLVGYGSHVDAERLKAARAAGCDLVLPRSAFVEKLESNLPIWLSTE